MNADQIGGALDGDRNGQASLIVQRDDGKWSIGWCDDAPGPFDSRADAARIARLAYAVGAP
jgi:hypothetical protein